MARTVVLIFLIDTLPEFSILLNQTLHEAFLKLPTGPDNTLQQCNSDIAKHVLKKANRERSKNNSNWKLFKTKEEFQNLPPHNVFNVFDNSIPDSSENSIENVQDYFDQNDIDNYSMQQRFKGQANNIFTKNTDPESPPFLAAIFETLSNVTAQTCAGSLLSAHWVVTAASCLGILSEFYGNGINSTQKSRYTIVAGSSNPLMDGSIHNVTDILLQPLPENKEIFNSFKVNSMGAHLAMMKISPGLPVEKMKILEDKEDGSDAMVYGWTLVVNESSHDAMLPASISMKMTTSTQCKSRDGGLISMAALCFIPELMGSVNSTKLGVGGPVMVHNGILGVVMDDRLPMLVEPLAAHAWIHALVNTDL